MAVNNLNTPGVGIQPSIVDAKGDLIAGTAADAVSRLAAGTNGHVLVAASGETTGLKWNDPGTVGGLVHINTTAFSAVASQSFNNVFSATYDNYLIVCYANMVNAAQLRFRLRAGGSDNSTASSYVFATAENFYAPSYSDAGLSNGFAMNLLRPFLAQRTVGVNLGINSGTASADLARPFHHTQTVSYDGFTIFAQSGNMSGEVSIYGYRKS
jgi:hypothetical protein